MSEGFLLGPWLMRWHGFLLVIGIAAGALLSALQARRRGFDTEIIYDLFLPVLIWGTVGARLWHILTRLFGSAWSDPLHYLTHPLTQHVLVPALKSLGLMAAQPVDFCAPAQPYLI